MPEYGALLSPQLVSAAPGRRVFAVLLVVALIGGAGLCVYASQWADALITFRTAMQISGCLCILAVLVGFCARMPRNRRHLGEVTAAATTFFTGVAMLYLSYFQWSELPAAPASALLVKSAPAVWNPAEHVALPKSPLRQSASAGGTAPEVPRIAWERLPPERQQLIEPLVTAAPMPVMAADDGCAASTGLSWFFCQERSRLERCATREEADPPCPSVIPVSPPR